MFEAPDTKNLEEFISEILDKIFKLTYFDYSLKSDSYNVLDERIRICCLQNTKSKQSA